MTGVGGSLFAASTGNRFMMLGAGLLAAVLLFSLEAVRSWALFDDVRIAGAVDETHWNRMSIFQYLVIVGSVIIIGIAALVFLGYVPGMEMQSFNAFLAGFGIVGWLNVGLIALWERKNSQVLYSDGKRLYIQAGL
jgi:hypothetical protein